MTTCLSPRLQQLVDETRHLTVKMIPPAPPRRAKGFVNGKGGRTIAVVTLAEGEVRVSELLAEVRRLEALALALTRKAEFVTGEAAQLRARLESRP